MESPQFVKDEPDHYRLFFSTRFAIALLVLLCTCLQYSQKIDLSVNIICMVNHSALAKIMKSGNNSQFHVRDGPFVWTKPTQGLILSMFFWGYILSQLPGGILASRFGAKWVMGIAMLMNALCIMLYKTAAQTHYAVLMALRFLVGLGAGVIFPSVSQIWSKWGPKEDRSFLIGIAVSGSHLGSVFTLPLAGLLCSSTSNDNWSMLFYIIGGATLIWVAIWSVVYSNSPVTQRCISAKEKGYIVRNIPQSMVPPTATKSKIPWSAIFRSVPCWSQFVCHTLLNWGFYTLLTCTPMYMSEILHFNIKSNGSLSAIPYILIWLSTTVSSFLADKLISQEVISRTVVRKSANLIGSLVPAAFLIGLCIVTAKSAYVGIALLSLGMAAFGVSFGAGFLCVCNDMTSKYASVVFGISNTMGTLPGIISPYITSLITKHRKLSEWRIVFILAATLWAIGGIQFAFFGSADPQHFDELPASPKEADDESSKLRTNARRRFGR